MNKKILVAKLFHESNGFNPRPTPASDFEIFLGDEVLTKARMSGTTLGGIVRSLDAENVDVIPVVSVNGSPSGLVDHSFYVEVRDLIVSKAKEVQPDAIALELHGAMATSACDDVEGDFLHSLRAACGQSTVIGVGLDLHAHVTPMMLENADICIACKENPHADVVACGQNVVELMLEVFAGHLRPVTVMGKTRQILPGKMETTSGPLADMHARARALCDRHPEVWDISLYNVFRFLDVKDIGSAAVVLTNDAPYIGRQIVEEFTEAFWTRRDEFWDDLLSLDDALDQIVERSGNGGLPIVIADMGDRTLAGAPGDSNVFLAAALSHPKALKGVVPVTDPRSVEIAKRGGVGAEITLKIGGQQTPGFSPLEVKGKVLSLSDGSYEVKGPYQAGESVSLGEAAVVEVSNGIKVLLHTKPGFTHDPNAFESQGIQIADLDFVLVKSGYHFTMNFEGLGQPMFVATPGVSYYTPGGMPRSIGKVWPEHDVSEDAILPPEVFRRIVIRDYQGLHLGQPIPGASA